MWQGLEPSAVDGVAATLAGAVGAVVDPAHGAIDLLHQVLDVVLDREIAFSLERRAAGIGEVLVQTHFAREVALRPLEGFAIELGVLALEGPVLLFELGPDPLRIWASSFIGLIGRLGGGFGLGIRAMGLGPAVFFGAAVFLGAVAFLAGAFLTAVFFAVVFLATGFFAVVFFLATGFFAVVFLAAAFLGAAFLAVVFLTALRVAFLAGLRAVFLAAGFLAVDLRDVGFLAGLMGAGR